MEPLILQPDLSKSQITELVERFLGGTGFSISTKDFERPWGGFFVIDEKQIRAFKAQFFPEIELSKEQYSQKLSPKFLLIAPGARLSWQYHYRRAELWTLLAGEAAISRSMDNEQGEVVPMATHDVVSLRQGERHRLIGTHGWGIVAEIWIHTDDNQPSDEDDIVRLQDDYARK
ncbi:MAG: phosphoheptose isomerase [Bacteroidetes bacterium]|nr:phosphoheptose isomerase [Bacteroidota bacterium]